MKQGKLQRQVASFILFLPFLIIYMVLFSLSMDTALDRDNYLTIMNFPFEGREEPGIHVISYILNIIFLNPKIKLFIFQASFFVLLFLSLLMIYKNNVLLKLAVSLFLLITAFSNPLGIQIRIGSAIILFVFVSLGLRKKPNLRNVLWYLLPCLMHYGVIPLVITAYACTLFRVITPLRFLAFFTSFLLVTFLIVKGSVFFLSIIGINPYYYQYFDFETDVGTRLIPFNLLYYIVLCVILLKVSDIKHEFERWIIFSGLVFPTLALLSGILFFYKIMVPFVFYGTIYTVNKLILIKNTYVTVFMYLMMFGGFVYYSFVVGLL